MNAYREFYRDRPVADIRQQTAMNHLVEGHDVIFNLAGQVSHIDRGRLTVASM